MGEDCAGANEAGGCYTVKVTTHVARQRVWHGGVVWGCKACWKHGWKQEIVGKSAQQRIKIPSAELVVVLLHYSRVGILKWTLSGHGFACFDERTQILAFVFAAPTR